MQRNDEAKSVLLKGLSRPKMLLRHLDDVKDIANNPITDAVVEPQ